MSVGDQRSGPSLRVEVTDHRGRPVRDGGLGRWLVRVAPPKARGSVAVALVGDARMRALNRQFAGIDSATDVLSFPASVQPHPRPAGATTELGDIVIATGMARRQARAAAHPLQVELRVLALHGLLHLLGYDHHVDAGRMARLERRLRRAGGLREGLIERGTAMQGRGSRR